MPLANELVNETETRAKYESTRSDGSVQEDANGPIGKDQRVVFNVDKATHRIRIPLDGEDEKHTTIYVEPLDWVEEKK